MPGERVIKKYHADGRTWAFIVHVDGRYRVALWDWRVSESSSLNWWRYHGRRHRFLRMADWHARMAVRNAVWLHRDFHIQRQRCQIEASELRRAVEEL